MALLQPYMTSIFVGLAGLLALIAVLAMFRSVNRRMTGAKGARLGVSEYLDIDKDRRLLLVRRDDVEHLILIGGDHDLVVEPGIDNGLHSQRAYTPSPSSGNVQQLPVRPAPRPPVFGTTRPTLRSIDPTQRQSEPSIDPVFPPRDQA